MDGVAFGEWGAEVSQVMGVPAFCQGGQAQTPRAWGWEGMWQAGHVPGRVDGQRATEVTMWRGPWGGLAPRCLALRGWAPAQRVHGPEPGFLTGCGELGHLGHTPRLAIRAVCQVGVGKELTVLTHSHTHVHPQSHSPECAPAVPRVECRQCGSQTGPLRWRSSPLG